jgi:cell wall-associated NlpC family hydrolase
MVKRSDIIAAARRRKDTPWVHQGRLDLVGLDCIGLVTVVALELDLLGPETATIAEGIWANYARVPDGSLADGLARFMVPVADPRPGDVIAFKLRILPQHVGILTERPNGLGLIHAVAPEPGPGNTGRVLETSYDGRWRARRTGAYTWPVALED